MRSNTPFDRLKIPPPLYGIDSRPSFLKKGMQLVSNDHAVPKPIKLCLVERITQ
jgi:hypothetical protein